MAVVTRANDPVLGGIETFFAAIEDWVPGAFNWFREWVLMFPEAGSGQRLFDLADAYDRAAQLYGSHLDDLQIHVQRLTATMQGDGGIRALVDAIHAEVRDLTTTLQAIHTVHQGVLGKAIEIEKAYYMAIINIVMFCLFVVQMLIMAPLTGAISTAGIPPKAILTRAGIQVIMREALRQLWQQTIKGVFTRAVFTRTGGYFTQMFGHGFKHAAGRMGMLSLQGGLISTAFTTGSQGLIAAIQGAKGHTLPDAPGMSGWDVVDSFLIGAIGGPLTFGIPSKVVGGLAYGGGQTIDNLFKIGRDQITIAIHGEEEARRRGLLTGMTLDHVWEGLTPAALLGAIVTDPSRANNHAIASFDVHTGARDLFGSPMSTPDLHPDLRPDTTPSTGTGDRPASDTPASYRPSTHDAPPPDRSPATDRPPPDRPPTDPPPPDRPPTDTPPPRADTPPPRADTPPPRADTPPPTVDTPRPDRPSTVEPVATGTATPIGAHTTVGGPDGTLTGDRPDADTRPDPTIRPDSDSGAGRTDGDTATAGEQRRPSWLDRALHRAVDPLVQRFEGYAERLQTSYQDYYAQAVTELARPAAVHAAAGHPGAEAAAAATTAAVAAHLTPQLIQHALDARPTTPYGARLKSFIEQHFTHADATTGSRRPLAAADIDAKLRELRGQPPESATRDEPDRTTTRDEGAVRDGDARRDEQRHDEPRHDEPDATTVIHDWAVPGSRAHGHSVEPSAAHRRELASQAQAVMRQVASDVGWRLVHEATDPRFPGDTVYHLTRGDERMMVRVTEAWLDVDAGAESHLNHGKTERVLVDGREVEVRGEYVVALNDRLATRDVERALAHELGELVADRARYERGEHGDPADVLVDGPPPPRDARPSPHDAGRVQELRVVARELARLRPDDPAYAALRQEAHALIDHLGLRDTGDRHSGFSERRRMVDEQLTSIDAPGARQDLRDVRHMLETHGKRPDQLDPPSQADLRAVREQAATDRERMLQTEQMHRAWDQERVPRPIPDDGAHISPERARQLADEAAQRRAARSAQTLAELRAEQERTGAPPKVKVQIGGGAALSGRGRHTLLVDDGGRWQSDAGTHIAQTADELRRLNLTRLFDPYQWANPDQRVPLEAVQYAEDTIAAAGPLLDGRAVLRLEGDRMYADVYDAGGNRMITVEVEGTPVIATGFPPEIIPGVNRDLGMRSVYQGIHDWVATVDPARADAINRLPWHEAATAGEIRRILGPLGDDVPPRYKPSLEAIERWHVARTDHPGLVLFGDEINLHGSDTSVVQTWVVAGMGGTAISGLEIHLIADRGGNTFLVFGRQPPPGLNTNPQWQAVVAEFGPSGSGRLHLNEGYDITGFDVATAPDGTPQFRLLGREVARPGEPTQPERVLATGGGLIASMGSRNGVPPALADLVDRALKSDPGSVSTRLMFDGSGQFLGYRVTVDGRPIDVTGAASRFYPLKPLLEPAAAAHKHPGPTAGEHMVYLTADTGMALTSAFRDAPPESGNFDGGYVAVARQATAYHTAMQRLDEGVGRFEEMPPRGPDHYATAIADTRFVPDGRTSGRFDALEFLESATEPHLSDFGGRVTEVERVGSQLRVRDAEGNEHYFRVEAGHGMRQVAGTTLRAGTPDDPHIVTVNDAVHPEQFPRVWLHEITESLDMTAAGSGPAGRFSGPATGGHAHDASPAHVDARLSERRYLMRLLGDPSRAWDHEALRTDLQGLDRELAAAGFDMHGLEPVPDPPATSGDRVWAIRRWEAEGRYPSVDEVIPTSHAEASRWSPAIAESLRPIVEAREFGGLAVRLAPDRPVLAGPDTVVVRLDVVDGSGVPVGAVHLTLSRGPDGRLTVSHDLVSVAEPHRGRGFYGEFNAHLESWYRQSGVDLVRVSTAGDGGYAHARVGVEWDPEAPHGARAVLERMYTELGRLHQEAAALRPGDPRLPEIHRQYEALHAVYERARTLPFGHVDYPTPREIADAGRPLTGDTGRDAMWAGKRVMLGAEWRGVKHISDTGPLHTRGEPSSPQVTAAAVPRSPTFHATARGHADPARVQELADGALRHELHRYPVQGRPLEVTTVSPRTDGWPGDAVARSVPVDRDGRDLPHGTVPPPDGGYRIEISDEAADLAVHRAVAHEVAEAREILDRRDAGEYAARSTRPTAPDVLHDGPLPAGARLSPHDVGRVAELRVLRDLAAHGEPASVRAQARAELSTLEEYLGLSHGPDAAARWELVRAHESTADASQAAHTTEDTGHGTPPDADGWAYDADSVGPLRDPARPLLENEGVLIDEAQGLQSRRAGRFDNVVEGTHGDPATKYLWTMDERGVNIALESTPFPTPRGNIVHTNISARASIGGEAWFGPENAVTINAGSGRFGDAAGITPQQWDAAAEAWRSLGYRVNAVPYGHR